MSETKIDQLDIVIKSSSDKAIKSLDKLTASLNAFKSNANFSSAIKNLNSLDSAIKKLENNNGLKKLSKGIGNTTKSFTGLGSLTKTVFKSIGINEVSHVISNGVKNMNDYIENMNLFTVAMGEFSKEATEYAQNLQDLMGIDMSQWARAQGTFMSMGKGFGLSSQKAYELSKGMTEISYDISSLFNLPIEESFLKVRSGIAGEIEPLRSLGFALSQATLQELARERGINKSINAMTEAEKAQLRYTAIVQQSRNMGVVGDFAKTLDSPANALRILKQQLLQLSRTIGSIFIPILITVIPYVQAFVKVLVEAVSLIAKLFNFEMPKWDNSSWKPDGVESVGGALDDATASAKKFKNAQMGFDELNVLDPNQGGSGGALGGGAGIDMNLDDVWDKSLFEEINKRTDEIAEKLKSLIPVITLIGAGFLAWKFRDKFIASLKNMPGLLSSISKVIKGLGLGLVAVGLFDVFTNSEYATKGLKTVTDVLGKFGNKINNFLSSIFKFNIPDYIKKLDLSIGDLLITAGGFLAFGPWGLAIEGVVLALKGLGWAVSPAIKQIDIFGEGISQTTKEKVEPFINSLQNLSTTTQDLYIRQITIDDVIAGDVAGQVRTISQTILNELDADRNEALANLQPLKALMDDEKYAELLNKVTTSYENQKNSILEGETQINEIIALAREENRALTEEEANIINDIQKRMYDTGIKHLTESEKEANLISSRLKDSQVAINTEQASQIIKKSLETKNKTIDNANKQYNGILMEAQTLLDTGKINKEEYDEIIKNAKNTKEETIKEAEDQYNNIFNITKEKMGDAFRFIDTTNGEIKSNWRVCWDDIKNGLKEDWEQIKGNLDKAKQDIDRWGNSIKNWYKENIAPYFTFEYWATTFSNIYKGFTQVIKNTLNTGIDMINRFIRWLNSKLTFSWGGLTLMGHEIYPGGSVQLVNIPEITQRFKDGGFIEDGLFTMNHGEIAGKFSNGQSVVANNQQIIEGIAQGVYQAFIKANNDSNKEQQVNLNVYLDGTQINASVERAREEQGVDIFGNEIGYVY